MTSRRADGLAKQIANLQRKVADLDRLASRQGHGGHLKETLYFTTDDTFDKADYPGLRAVRVTVVAAGAGGGGAAGGGSQASAGSGGGGGWSIKTILASALSGSESVTVGAGSSGGAAGNNGSGTAGTSSFGAHCSATGGGGTLGSANTSGNLNVDGAGGGQGSGGDINGRGGDGSNGRVIGGVFVNQGLSGGSLFGGARRQRASDVDGADAVTPGAGGAGAVATSTSRAGGDGADGIVIVELYA